MQGEAGTGKTAVSQTVTAGIAQSLGNRAFLLVAPNGAAAVNIGAETIHSASKMSSKASQFKGLGPKLLREMQESFDGSHFLVCDEYSMVRKKTLDQIDKRCQQIK